jgi:hypothetical protein
MPTYTIQSTGGVLVDGDGDEVLIIAVPGGILTGPVDALRSLVSQSTNFQAWVGANSSATAKLSVHTEAASSTGPLAYARPYALVSTPQLNTNIMSGDYNRGTMELFFEDNVPADYSDNPANAYNYFAGKLEAVLSEIVTIAGTGSSGELLVIGLTWGRKPQRGSFQEEDYMQALILVEFGAR